MTEFGRVNPSPVSIKASTGSQPARPQTPDISSIAHSARTAVVAQAQEKARLALGSRVEVQLKSVLKSGELEVRLRPLLGESAPRGQWSPTMRVGMADTLRPALLDALRTLSTAGQVRQGAVLKAEVVSLAPKVMLRLINSDSENAPRTQAWFAAQLRAHLPGAQRLTTTFANWARVLQDAGVKPHLPERIEVAKHLVQPERAEAAKHLPQPGRTEVTKHPVQPGRTEVAKHPVQPERADATKHLESPRRTQIVQNREFHQAVKEVLNHLASPRELTDSQRLPTTLRNSGIWLEALLARAGTASNQRLPLEADLKGQLLRLAHQLRSSPLPGPGAERGPPNPGRPQTETKPGGQPPPQRAAEMPTTGADRLAPLSTTLTREVDGMLKQLVTLQLQNADHGPDQPRWTLELPFQTNAGLLALDADIQRESARDDDDSEHWSMEIRLDLPVLGPLLISLTLNNNRLHASLVAEQTAGAERLRERLPELRAQLEDRDIEVASLNARKGSTERKPRPHPPLLSEQA